MDLDYALSEPCPAPLIDQSFIHDKRVLVMWDRSNRICLMIIKNIVPEAFRNAMFEEEDAKQFLNTPKERFTRSDKDTGTGVCPRYVSFSWEIGGFEN